MTLASESTHWYDKTGQPRYTVFGANGNERPTTLRDARKEGLVPSVTTVMAVAARPGLEAWKINQAFLAALTLPQIPGESLDSFKKRAEQDSREHARAAAELGTAVHASLEGFYRGNQYPLGHAPMVEAAVSALDAYFGPQRWLPEKSFCSILGYGGKVDLHSAEAVIDFKTKEFGPDDKLQAFDEQIIQLDAYRHGLGLPNAVMANLFVSVSHPGTVRLIVHPQGGNHFMRFVYLLEYWKLSKGYDPMGAQNNG